MSDEYRDEVSISYKIEKGISKSMSNPVYKVEAKTIKFKDIMKNFYSSLLFILIGMNSAFAQWDVVLDSVAPLNSIFFSNSNSGYAIGDNGTIYKTVDAGTTWVNHSFQTNTSLKDIYFPCSDTGYIVGGSPGIILKTVNQGVDWTIVKNYPNDLSSIYFIDSQTGYVVGTNQLILKTNDGGSTWNEIHSGLGALNEILFTTYDVGYAVGDSPEGGVIFKTTNAGNSWVQTVFNAYAGNSLTMNAIDFISIDTGFVGSFGFTLFPNYQEFGDIYITLDGGSNWTKLDASLPVLDIDFPTSSVGYNIGGSGPYGFIYSKTIDAGQSWISDLFTQPHEGKTSIFFTSSDTGFVTTRDLIGFPDFYGSVLKTTTGAFVNVKNQQLPADQLIVYPNPSNNSITFQNINSGKVIIYNIQSQIILEKGEDEFEMNLDISHLSQGLYIIMVFNDRKVQMGKLIKN